MTDIPRMRMPAALRGIQSRTFSSLRYRDWRLLWTGWLVTNTGDWMDQIALNWLILEMTESPLYLGLINVVRGVAILAFTLVGGVAADRLDRRQVLLTTQALLMALAIGLALLVFTGLVQVWHVFAIATLRGIAFSFNQPARQTLIPDLVPREELQNAIAINSLTFNLTRIVGPTIGGIIIASIGVAGCFLVNGLSFLPVMWTLLAANIPKKKVESRGGLRMALEGFTYVWKDSTLFALVFIATVPMFFGMPYLTMIAVFARDVLDAGPQGLGVLTAAASLGAVLGSLTLATLGNFPRKGLVMLGAMTIFAVLIIGYSWSPSFLLSALLLLGAGAMMNVYNSTNNTVLQLAAPDQLRGRIMSVVMLSRGIAPLGTAAAGALAASFGAPLAQSGMAAVVLLVGVYMLLTGGGLKKIE